MPILPTEKQLLRIKSFIGTSENAVRIQIWTAFIRLNLFVKVGLQVWLDKPFEEPPNIVHKYI